MFWNKKEFYFNSSWSKPFICKIKDGKEDRLVHESTQKSFKQAARFLNLENVPNDKLGVYLFRDMSDKDNEYVGETHGQSIRKRLANHVNGGDSGSKCLERGRYYLVRWAVSETPQLSEGLIMIYFRPKCNDRDDWETMLNKNNTRDMYTEAARLGLCAPQSYETFILHYMFFTQKVISSR